MNKYEYRSITINDIPAMADLLLNRQKLESKVFPMLNNSCLNTKYITDFLEKFFAKRKVIGIGAFDNSKLAGYIMGEIKFDDIRGRHVWVPYEGIAIRLDQTSELIRNLYAKVADLWLEQGCFMHYTIVPLGSQVYYDAFLRLSFFIQQVHGVMNMEDYKAFENASDVEIRVADKMDSELMGNMSRIIRSFQNSSPVFEPAVPDVVADIKEGYKGIVDDDEAMIFIAEKDMKGLGFQGYWPATKDLMSPDGGVELSIAGTYYSQSGSGVGKRLMNECYRIMKQKGYNYMITDWRVTNLSSSTFWPKCGFKTIAYRMVRYIDRDVAWANFSNPSIKQLY